MRAIVNEKYGSPEVAKLMVIDKPIPKEMEVLIKIHATTVNRTDAGFRSAEYFISRFWTGLFKPKYKILGCEFAGEIEQVGDKVTLFKKGDKVFGFDSNKCGSHAEYKIIEEREALALMPQNLTYYEAAPICEGGHYALCDIRAANVKAGQNVLVNGTTGAIGSAAVQLLKHFGAKVTAVCDTKNMMLVKSLGADFVIDYTKEDFTKTDQKFDFIFDAVGKSSFGRCKHLLLGNGIYISTELGKKAENVYLALITPILGGKKVLFPIPTIKKEDVIFLKNLVENGEYKPLLDRQYTLEQIVEAYKYVETGQKRGNVVIRVI
jgi:NADPH:quinone reductase-like Zn-dependent oxidoreductase